MISFIAGLVIGVIVGIVGSVIVLCEDVDDDNYE